MEMDLVHHRYADFESLRLYCHRVAGVVGELSASIFGYTRPETLEYARNLGLAFQLTNIIRDVGEDARRGRVYLPLDELARFGLTAEDILALRGGGGVREADGIPGGARARLLRRRPLATLPRQDRRSQRAGLIMAAIYRTLLEEIAATAIRCCTQRIALTPLRKLWIAWRTWIRS